MPQKAQHARSYRHVPAFIRDLRVKAGMTQRELGARLGKPQSWVYNCESGNRRVDVGEFIAWCQACDVQPTAALRPAHDAIVNGSDVGTQRPHLPTESAAGRG